MFLKCPTILQRHIKMFINEIVRCLRFCLKISSVGSGGRWRGNEIRHALIVAEAGFGPMGLILLFSLHFYTFEILHNSLGGKKEKKNKIHPGL